MLSFFLGDLGLNSSILNAELPHFHPVFADFVMQRLILRQSIFSNALQTFEAGLPRAYFRRQLRQLRFQLAYVNLHADYLRAAFFHNIRA